MKKTVQKAIQKLSFSDQLKSTPKEIKMFFAGLLVIVAAIAFVLPNISGKMLQGNILNVKSSVNGYGYGYGYGSDNGTRFGYGYVPLGQCFLIETDKETKISCPKKVNGNPEQKDLALQDGYGYGFGYGLDGKNGYFEFNIKNIGNVQMNSKLSNIYLFVNNNEIPSSQYTINIDSIIPSIINPGQIYKIKGLIKLKDIVLDEKSNLQFNISTGNPEQDQNLGNNGVYITFNNNPIKNSNNNICKTPENILACDLKLNTCPQQCRLEVCKTPENTLACSLKLDTCPVECKYDGTTPPAVNCQSPMNVLACALGLDSCPVECRDTGTTPPVVDCQSPENVLACSMELDSCPVECRDTTGSTTTRTTGSTTTRTPWLDRDNQSGAGDYETYKDFTVAPCGGTGNVVSSRYEAIDGKAHSDLKLHVNMLNVYCVNAENNNRCVDYKIQYECKN